MEYIKLTHENLEKEHICCAISNNNDCQVASKKAWLKERLDEGLVFLKGDVRGKCFIEYIPAEAAWAPIDAPNYMYIDCFWISGQYKGSGYSNDLLNSCISDSKAKGKSGICVISSEKKKVSFLSDPKYLSYKGFSVADTLSPYFTLMYLPFDEGAAVPKFKDCVKHPQVKDKGFTVYYDNQCPFTAKYVPLLDDVAKQNGVALKTVHITSREEAQNAPTPFTAFTLFYDGEFVTHEILSEQKFQKIIQSYKA